jgi:plasmid stabilization system protein ParE
VPPVRAYPQVSHVIVYEIEDESLIVLRIRSARENWAADPLGNDP